MGSQTYHRNKITGVRYLYSVQSYWDREKKAPRNRQVCLGRVDEETGEVIPSKRKQSIGEKAMAAEGFSAKTQVLGPILILSKLAEETGLARIIKRCFPTLYEVILSLVYFLVQKGLPLSHCEAWSSGHKHPANQLLMSQRVSEVLLQITEADRQHFLSRWLRKRVENDYLCYDITSISSYAKSNEFLKYGYNRDGESLPQINLAMLFGQKSRLPASYRRLQGNIPDVSTLQNTIKALDLLEAKKLHFVLDRGFYSEANVDELFARHYHFTLAVPSGRKWVQRIIDLYYESAQSPTYYRAISEKESLFVVTHLHAWGKHRRRAYLHLYYNSRQAADEFDRFTNEILQYKQELESGKRVEEHEEAYAQYFIIKNTPKRGLRIAINEPEIQKYRKRYAGYFCLLSTPRKDPMEVLRTYRAKEAVENSFDDLKNQLDMKRLRIHSSSAMDSRVFLQFLALVLICQIRNKIQEDSTLKNLTVREVMEHMESIVEISFPGRYRKILSEIGPLQQKIMNVFDISLPT